MEVKNGSNQSVSRLNPLKRVKFISILMDKSIMMESLSSCLNPLKRVKFISIETGGFGSSEFHFQSQSPQTGQVYFNTSKGLRNRRSQRGSQSPQTGQVYFNHYNDGCFVWKDRKMSQSPQTGQVYFNSADPDIPSCR